MTIGGPALPVADDPGSTVVIPERQHRRSPAIWLERADWLAPPLAASETQKRALLPHGVGGIEDGNGAIGASHFDHGLADDDAIASGLHPCAGLAMSCPGSIHEGAVPRDERGLSLVKHRGGYLPAGKIVTRQQEVGWVNRRPGARYSSRLDSGFRWAVSFDRCRGRYGGR